MDIRYFDYIEESDKYYMPSKSRGKKFILEVPEKWQLLEGGHWVNVFPQEIKLKQDQGWKLHISTDIYEAQEVLDAVAKVLFEKNIAFKFVIDKMQLINKNSKYAARESSAKFITIYPNEEELHSLLLDLEERLKNYKKGAYILSDRRWKDTNIYYRYGGFSAKYLPDGRLAIQDKEGNLVEDKRLPYYSTPDWVEKPDYIIENEQELDQENPLDAYNIMEALHFSNGGGVYLAEDKSSKKLVLKESRLNAGLDGLNNDAVYRLKKEYHVLSELADLECIPRVYDIFDAWEHKFLVQDYVEGQTLASWISRNYPFSEKSNKEEYIANLKKIAVESCKALKAIHDKGYTHGDIQPKNIVVTDDYKIKLIDFENYGKIGERGDRSLGTPGFYKKFNDYNEEKDWTGLLRVFKTGLLAVANLEMIANKVYGVHYDWIKREFGQEAAAILDMIVSYSTSPNYDLLSESKKPFQMYGPIEQERLYEDSLQSLVKNIDFNRTSLIYGDIKQYIYKYGQLSIAYGASGILLLLKRLDELNFDISLWLENFKKVKIKDRDYALFSGLTGIANSLIELGFEDYANDIYKKFLEDRSLILETRNISLESGLSGIGLAALDQYISRKNEEYLIFADSVYERIRNIFLEDPTDISNEYSGFTNDGLMYGWTGAIWLAYALYNLTGKEKYLDFAKDLFKYELDKIKVNNDMSFLLSEDEKLLPYFSNGSAGFLLTAILIREHIDKSTIKDLISGISKALTAKPPVFFGLFEGYLGLAYVAKIVDKFQGKSNLYKKMLATYSQYILRDENGNIALPGNFSYKVSYDLATGLGGLLASLDKDKFSGFIWLPLKNQNELFKYNSKF
ncbi:MULTISPECIES: class III lanthionine synthetase LanKC [unclassified Gemella]|uniref:class III lanthionine synthetase LanKC n=1 Tax=unclassified Gemella TaxID=2624949 RepID=UPI0015CF8AE1|nr:MULTISPECIES: class III lanthionine synthetase LanKC [unclassified Gemella]MBF0709977.1 class III lanthionine synthetase LanKC [Gemella sp. GL1.1]NYS27321.1 protein kinase/lanthionine synthetase C family protein [Gemella sp. GL1]